MDRRAHYFPAGGPCAWCKAPLEAVSDRRAPPFCTQHPEADSLDERAFDAIDSVAGY